MGNTRKAPKPLFFAIIAVALIAAGIIGVIAFGLVNDNTVIFDLPTGTGGFSVMMDLQLLENGKVVESWSATDAPQNPLSVLGGLLAIVWQGPSGDKVLDFASNTYTICATPTWKVETKDLSGSSARVDLAITSAEYKWTSTGAYVAITGPVWGASDQASASWPITTATAAKTLSAGARAVDLSVVTSPPPPPGGTASLYIKYSYTLKLTVDGTVVDTKSDSTVCEIVFKNTTGGAFSSVSVSFATSLDTYPIYYGGTP